MDFASGVLTGLPFTSMSFRPRPRPRRPRRPHRRPRRPRRPRRHPSRPRRHPSRRRQRSGPVGLDVALANAACARATAPPTQIANPACIASNAPASRRSLAAPATDSPVWTTACHRRRRLRPRRRLRRPRRRRLRPRRRPRRPRRRPRRRRCSATLRLGYLRPRRALSRRSTKPGSAANHLLTAQRLLTAIPNGTG